MSRNESNSTTDDTACTICVVYDAIAQTLAVEPPTFTLRAGETPLWNFEGLTEDLLPMVRFTTDGRQGLGPFRALRQNNQQVWGLGNDGEPGSHPYQAAVVRYHELNRPAVLSEVATLENEAEEDSTPTVWFTLDIENESFEPNQKVAAYYPGDVLTFRFVGLGKDWVPRIHFSFYKPLGAEEALPSSAFGPFENYCYGKDHILASGSNGVYGTYLYRIFVVGTENGKLVQKELRTSTDPVIDAEEDPITPGAQKAGSGGGE